MSEEKVKLAVQAHPGAKRNEVLGFRDGVLHLKIAAPALKGKANQELVSFLGDILGIAKNRVIIEKGASGKNKLLSIVGLDSDTVRRVIEKNTGKS